MRIQKSTAVIIAVLLATVLSTVAGFTVSPGGYLAPLAGPPSSGATGGIVGSISIGNVAPLCKVPPTAAPAPPYYNQIEVVITPSPTSDLPLTVPVNWVLVGGCWVHGTFKIGLNPGTYSLTLSDCSANINISFNTLCTGLPKTAIVESGTWTRVEIMITTGIY